MHRHKLLLAALGLASVLVLAGCGGVGDLLLAYTGGGLPPGEPDIGGVILAETGTAQVWTAEQVPVVGATVVLYRGTREVGRTLSGAEGYFRFERPASGAYRVDVEPPAGSGLRRAERQVQHRAGQQSYLTIVLERDTGP